MVVLWTGLYVLAILCANLTLGKMIPLPVFGLLSVGTLFFGAVFTLRDRLHEYGLTAVYRAIGFALVVNALVGWLAMSQEVTWLRDAIARLGLSTYFPLEATADWPRFIVASFVAILISELTDTVVYQRLMRQSWLTRALSSNVVSIPLDTIIFTLMAFYGIMGWYDMGQIVFADLVFKAVIATVLALVLNATRKPNYPLMRA